MKISGRNIVPKIRRKYFAKNLLKITNENSFSKNLNGFVVQGLTKFVTQGFRPEIYRKFLLNFI